MSVEHMLADYVIAIEGHPNVDIVQIIRIGQGKWAVQHALKLSDKLRRITTKEATPEEARDYHYDLNTIVSGTFSAAKGRYKIGMIAALELELATTHQLRRSEEPLKGADSVMTMLFEENAPKNPEFRELLVNYLQRYHPDKV